MSFNNIYYNVRNDNIIYYDTTPNNNFIYQQYYRNLTRDMSSITHNYTSFNINSLDDLIRQQENIRELEELQQTILEQNMTRNTRRNMTEMFETFPVNEIDVNLYLKHSDEPLETCSVCLEDNVENMGELSELSCKHNFHTNCIKEWLKNCMTCPLCRKVCKKIEE